MIFKTAKCFNGHIRTEKNTQVNKNGRLRCRVCECTYLKLRRMMGVKPIVEKTCASRTCGKIFETNKCRKKYCCPPCEWAEGQRNRRANPKVRRRINFLARLRWKKHPNYMRDSMRKLRADFLLKHGITYDKSLIIRKALGSTVDLRREK